MMVEVIVTIVAYSVSIQSLKYDKYQIGLQVAVHVIFQGAGCKT
jgi:hypothetical protein